VDRSAVTVLVLLLADYLDQNQISFTSNKLLKFFWNSHRLKVTNLADVRFGQILYLRKIDDKLMALL